MVSTWSAKRLEELADSVRLGNTRASTATAVQIEIDEAVTKMRTIRKMIEAGFTPEKIAKLLRMGERAIYASSNEIDPSDLKTPPPGQLVSYSKDTLTHTEAEALRAEVIEGKAETRELEAENATLRQALADLAGKIDEVAKEARSAFVPPTFTTLPLWITPCMPDAWRYRLRAASFVGKECITNHDKWAYLHMNGEVRIRRDEPDVTGNDFVRAVWRMQIDRGLRASIALDALALGARGLPPELWLEDGDPDTPTDEIAMALSLVLAELGGALHVCCNPDAPGLVGYGDSRLSALVDYWRQTQEFKQHDERIKA